VNSVFEHQNPSRKYPLFQTEKKRKKRCGIKERRIFGASESQSANNKI
jgi:hypothetical protein